ncbi:PREDICTED: uncharacterized protein LOC109463478 [Branchiostoma belcheri]|uniref:Uncharacterized protein LOC109463478 n=1 Tax=Branchiostoma belcheri TaxID=7741 RepID=A0A6P4XZL5_BRABE|nr:PREDICTED: uncharacterized protein LOC109463478 [Branchiostoma belcheri]
MLMNRFAPVVLVLVAVTWSRAAAGPVWPGSAGSGPRAAREVRRDATVPDGLYSPERIGDVTNKMMDWAIIRELIMSEVNTALRESSAARDLIRSEVNKSLRETSRMTKSLAESLVSMLQDGEEEREVRRTDSGHPPLTFPRLG